MIKKGNKISLDYEGRFESGEAYGKYRSELAKKVPKSALPPSNMEITEGMMLMANSPDGMQFPVRIAKVEREFVVLDMNHPLAGKKLIFKIKIIDENVKE